MKTISFLIFNDFETLDLFGPVEIFGHLEESFSLRYYSLEGGLVTSKQKVRILTEPMSMLNEPDILVIPGGMGTRALVNDAAWIFKLRQLCTQAENILTVCTGSALLAKTGLLDGLSATSNKRAMDWVVSTNSKVNWVRRGRWVVEGKYYTSSGVSAGIDMSLGFVADKFGHSVAERLANDIEYTWHSSKEEDPFWID